MKRLIILLLAGIGPALSSAQTNADGTTIDIDEQASLIEWTGKKLTGEHYGEVKLKKGTLIIQNKKLIGGLFEIAMMSITCTDITDQKSNRRLVDHLKSEDFFAVQKYPIAKLEIMKVDTKNESNYNITGNLTIKNTTRPVTFHVHFTEKEGLYTATANITFDRSKYDVRFGSQSFSLEDLGDKMVYDDIEMKVTLISTPSPNLSN